MDFDQQSVLFQAPNRCEIRVSFDEPQLTSAAGLALLMPDPWPRAAIEHRYGCRALGTAERMQGDDRQDRLH